ncbi:MAG: thioesterase family protein [Frankiaceae bacterium]|nr:thioesterase family protein [Frankiaceae bacterium]
MSDNSETPAFFTPDGAALVPQPFARSPWGQILHGRLIGGLAARAADGVLADDPELTCSRITVELFRSAPLEPVAVSTRTIRAGRRIMVIETTVEQGGEPIGQGKAVLLRRSEQPPGILPPPPAWHAEPPADLDEPRQAGHSGWRAPWDSWPVAPSEGAAGARGGMWMRDRHPLVAGEPLTPLVRIGIAADLASPIGNSGSAGLGFINADYTLYLSREPRGELIGIQPHGHLSDRGVAVAQCIAYDLDGAFGFLGTTAVANSLARSRAELG